ncbi:MAG TPA: group II intron reverse transcriptase/maturase [Spirochaetia bacterium]|nr:group II intron reverse transcriptase/maturase [Spirochaetia bacterium]
MSTGLARIAEIAAERPNEMFTSLAHHINVQFLRECHKEMSNQAAPGIDGVTKEEYEMNLDANLDDLVKRLKRGAYRPQPVRRTYIPKLGTNKVRPLGIPAYEDKLVQTALSKIVSAIYEADFLDFSYGFRPNRCIHDALRKLNYLIETRKVNYVVDADIKGFFDHVDHEWLMKFLSQRIVDPSIHRIIRRILKAGYMEAEELHESLEGTPQGGCISPVLANIYLHYVLDIWFEKAVKKACRGDAYIVRYADDFICCFQYEEDAMKFFRALPGRLGKFNLELSQEKSKVIGFGRFAAESAKKRGLSKPDTFDFLGFTHYCSQSRQGKFRVKRRTSRKKFKAALLRMKEWIQKHRTVPLQDLIREIGVKLQGYYRQCGVTDNFAMLAKYRHKTIELLFKWLNRRSQRRSWDWDKFRELVKTWNLPRPRIYVNIYERG